MALTEPRPSAEKDGLILLIQISRKIVGVKMSSEHFIKLMKRLVLIGA